MNNEKNVKNKPPKKSKNPVEHLKQSLPKNPLLHLLGA